MTAGRGHDDEPLIPMPALRLDALRQAVATVAPSRLPEFFQEIQEAFSHAGGEDSVYPIRHFCQRWGAAVATEHRPSVATRLHAAERALANPDAGIRQRAVEEAASIVRAAYREVAGGWLALGMRHRSPARRPARRGPGCHVTDIDHMHQSQAELRLARTASRVLAAADAGHPVRFV